MEVKEIPASDTSFRLKSRHSTDKKGAVTKKSALENSKVKILSMPYGSLSFVNGASSQLFCRLKS